MIKRALLGIMTTFLLLVGLLMVFIMDWRKPEDILYKSFMIPIAASDMRCAMYLNDEYKIVDTQNYDPAPYLMSFLQPIRETEIFTKRDHEIEVVAWPLPNPRGKQERAYCRITLTGSIDNELENLFSRKLHFEIGFDEQGEVVIKGADKETATIDIKRNEDGSVRYISIIQAYPINY
ncbi:hypothetical protein MMG00_00945 [Ignatzschineria rhizosphaerae]|uniref:Uncharacterized protein n=1 Tax=Ignatzschineria rhizosphaerae TaxID=2923279 RepID=A0ABY3X448_9GAMM|nr:hypothetical protein [Ignatzschineria rhizosphaerae]UNM96469.1 hypothetical protein MMG00_00945 [Ignatzschineria rhizosphaerae]